MSKFNKNYRIRTEVGKDTNLHVKLDRDYDILEIMSLKINQENAYKLHSSDYGVIAGRVLANNAFGVPNAKISIFIPIDETDSNDVVKSVLYPYNRTTSKDKNNIRYNLLPNAKTFDCHTVIGTFPEKQYALDNDSILEIFEKYYKYTTRTNNAGDYIIFGVPTGVQNVHVDIDLSDIGILSQRPRDMVYKGYDINQFENPNKFKHDTNLSSLTQVISQDKTTDVVPFWSTEETNMIGITRCDIDIEYKFEPTCVFMGSVVSDTASNGFSQKCIPTPSMGAMDEITTGSGTIEMIRKKPDGSVEEFQIQGTQLINGDGVWCYQIPMNLDYMMTDEFGNMVPTNDPNKGVPTRTKVRFRMSMQDFDNNNTNIFRGKMLIPHNPKDETEVDWDFGTNTKEHSYRDLFWNCVYSVKSYIPRIQKGSNWKSGKFTGFKRVNYYADNNPIPYNNIRIRLPFMYVIMCALIKFFFRLVGWVNRFTRLYVMFTNNKRDGSVYTVLDGTICDDNLENICFIPGIKLKGDGGDNSEKGSSTTSGLIGRTIVSFVDDIGGSITGVKRTSFSNSNDNKSINDKNTDKTNSPKVWVNNKKIYFSGISITNDIEYLIQCIELNLAQEYKVIQFDFYNDWINGLVYIPRWFRKIRKKMTFIFPSLTIPRKISACNENYKVSGKKRNIVQQCSLSYDNNFQITNHVGCKNGKLKCHKTKEVRKTHPIFTDGGIVNTVTTSKNQNVYYFKPIEKSNGKIVKLFSIDIILLGTLNDCDKWGISNNLKEMLSSTYQMPTNLPLTDSDIEGNDYSIETSKRGYVTGYNGDNIFGKNSSSGDKLNEVNWGGTFKNVFTGSEDGNYTEVSGIDWGYIGPLQNAKSETSLYKPGGHFLGLSCVNSETTIKSCVNLSRICEYGVYMSQRQTIAVPDKENKKIKIKEYAIVPNGFISKDEISDTSFRQIFATLNSNKLKTIIDINTGYPVYEFKYINPTNFGGEMKNKIFNDVNYNRKISDNVVEKYYEYNDDDDRNSVSVTNVTIDEKQIMRTGELKDEEYLKFRFGVNSFSMDNVKNKFLISNNNSYAFPIYENSFYFYFGLHDGKTAIDEFKKQYYSVCDKSNDLITLKPTLKIEPIETLLTGLDTENSNGSISFKVDFDDTIINDFTKDNDSLNNFIKNNIFLNNESNSNISFNKNTNIFKITKLKAGSYNLIVESNEYSDSYMFEIKTINMEPSIKSEDFYKDTSNENCYYKENNNEVKDITGIGGYIEILLDVKFLNKSGITETINLIPNFYLNSIKLECSEIDEYGNSTRNEDNDITVTQNMETVEDFVCIKNNSKSHKENIKVDNNILRIPVPSYINAKETVNNFVYKVYIKTYMNSSKDNFANINNYQYTPPIYSWDMGDFEIKNGFNLNISFNGVSYNDFIKSYVETETYTTNWWENELFWKTFTTDNTDVKTLTTGISAGWALKENIFMTKADDASHMFNIELIGGRSPYNEYIYGKKGNEINILSATNVFTKPTHNYFYEDINTETNKKRMYDELFYIANDSSTVNGKGVYKNSSKNANAVIIKEQNVPNFYIGDYLTIINPKDNTEQYYKWDNTEINNNGNVIPESSGKKFILPLLYKPFFSELWLIYSNEIKSFYLHGNVYNGKTWTIEKGFNNNTLNGGKLICNIKPTDEDYVCNKTSYTHGDNFKNRVSSLSCSIGDMYGLTPLLNEQEMELTIGSKYEDYTDEMSLTAKNSFYRLSLDNNDNGDIIIKNLNNTMNYYNFYLIRDDIKNKNYNGDNIYKYPIIDGVFNKSRLEKIYNGIMSGNIKSVKDYDGSGIISYEITEEKDSNGGNAEVTGISTTVTININNLGNEDCEQDEIIKRNEEIYFIAVQSNKNNDNTLTNRNNVVSEVGDKLSNFNAISISNLIDLSTITKFFPLEFTIGGIDVYDNVNNSYQTTLYIASKGVYKPSSKVDGALTIKRQSVPNFYIGDNITVINIGTNAESHYTWTTDETESNYLDNFRNKTYELEISPKNSSITQLINIKTESGNYYGKVNISGMRTILGLQDKTSSTEINLDVIYNVFDGKYQSPKIDNTKEINIIYVNHPIE